MLNHISIRRLFSLYDYEISLNGRNGNPDKHIMFLTGPNGMGKSTILRSVASLYKQEISFFLTFPFERMHFDFDACEVELSQWTESVEVEVESDMPALKTVYVKCNFMTKGDYPIAEAGQWVLQDGHIGKPSSKMPNMEIFFNSERCLYISDHRLDEGFDDAFVQPDVLKDLLSEIQSRLTVGFAPGHDEIAAEVPQAQRQKNVLDVFEKLQQCEIGLPYDISPYQGDEEMSDHILQSSCLP